MNLVDRLYVEVDDSCGICGNRQPLTIHHIDGNHGNNAYDNQIVICEPCHVSHHQGKAPDRATIEARKFHLIVKTLTTYGVNALKIADRNNTGVIAMPFLLYHLVELGLMVKKETQMTYGQVEATSLFAITDGGRAFLNKWCG